MVGDSQPPRPFGAALAAWQSIARVTCEHHRRYGRRTHALCLVLQLNGVDRTTDTIVLCLTPIAGVHWLESPSARPLVEEAQLTGFGTSICADVDATHRDRGVEVRAVHVVVARRAEQLAAGHVHEQLMTWRKAYTG